MTCFWNGLLARLSVNEINRALCVNYSYKPEPKEFAILLKFRAVLATDVICGERLSQKALDENLESVLNYNVDTIYNGYDCSTCDPFLLLVCQLFVIDIYHNYNGSFVKYVNTKNINGKILSVSSDKGHLW